MSEHDVQGPEGQRWIVRRRWVPRLGAQTVWGRIRRRFRRPRGGNAGDALDVAALGEPSEIVTVVVFGVVLLVLFIVAAPLVLAVLDVLLLALLALLGLVARVLFRRPWIVEARAADGSVLTWRVVGWRASRDRRQQIEQSLRAGVVPSGAPERGGSPRT